MKKIKTEKNIYKIIRNCHTIGNDEQDETIREKLEDVCSVLRNLNINTLPGLLVDAQLQKVEYRWYRTDFRTRSLWKNVYMTVRSIGEDNIEQEETFVQNHEVGSKVYQLYRVRFY